MSRIGKEKGGSSKRAKSVLLFVIVCLFCLILFAARGRFQSVLFSGVVSTVIMPFQFVASWVSNEVQFATETIADISAVHEQNEMLRKEVEKLRIQAVAANEYQSENERLRTLLDYKQAAHQFDLMGARVIGREATTWSSIVVVDRGAKDGIEENMVVVTEKGLVGHIVEVGPVSSKVQLITDHRSSVGTLVQRAESRVSGLVEGDADNPLMPCMVNIPKTSDVVEGDVIVTSGFGGAYPKGIVVGLVSSIENDTGGLLKICQLEPAVDFRTLEDVMIITASREAAPPPLQPPAQTPGTETDPKAQAAQQQAAGGGAQ